jgi:hypothetical protein
MLDSATGMFGIKGFATLAEVIEDMADVAEWALQ